MTQDVDVAIVGAGVAGLAAAMTLRRAGRDCRVLEATGRIGGRAWTRAEPALAGRPLDHGASWLHDADANPLTAIARARGDRLIDSGAVRLERSHIGTRVATEAEAQAYLATEARLTAALDRLVGGGAPDQSYAAALDQVATPDDAFWLPTIEAWEAPVIAAADADRLSLHDWHSNRLGGRNLMVAGGLGHFVADALGALAGPVTLATPVTRIDWHGRGVALHTPAGTLRAGACIVTVSTGVLAAGALAFDPALPEALRQAIDGLPMGLATKVALRIKDFDRLGLKPHTVVDRALARRGEPMIIFNVAPQGFDHVTGYFGGAVAWELAREGHAATLDFARAEWRRLFGADADAVLDGTDGVVTGWGDDPWYRGAYCHARPGHAAARRYLAANPLAPRLCFAGEALSWTHGGTVGGAFETGVQAARKILAAK